MAKETAIAYGIEFYVGRRSRDRALSDVRAAGEMVNLASLKSYKTGAQEREKAHGEAVKDLRKNSETAIKELAKTRKTAIGQAASTFEALKPMKPADALATGKIDTKDLDAYEKKFSGQIRGMDGALKEFASSAGNLGMEFSGAGDAEDIYTGFGEGDAQQRKAALDDLDTRSKRRDDLIKKMEKENEIAGEGLQVSLERAAVLSGPKGELASEKAKLRAMKKTDKGYERQRILVRDLQKEQHTNNKTIKLQKGILEDNIKELEKQTNLKEGDKVLLRELKRLHSELTGEEIRTSKEIRDNKNKERELDKEKREDDARAIQNLKEKNRLQQEYSRHLDDAIAQIKGGLKNAFVIGTAAIAALNYKLMAVVSTFQDFEKELINANSIWQESNETLFNISDRVVEFGTKFGINMGQASQGLYQYASAGVEAGQAMEMLNHTLKLSMAVQGDHNTLSKLTTQTLMGFGMEFSDTAEVTDKFAHSINKSLIEWDDLASSVKFALPFFTSTGQSLEQLLGGLEILTNRALEAGIAGRGLRQALAEFAQHADDNASAFRRMGVEIMDTDGNMKQLTEIARDFQAQMGEGVNDMDVMVALMEDLNVRGATAFVHLVQNADEFTAAVGDLENASGSAHEMAMIQQESLANQIQVVKNALLAPFILSDEIGQEAGYLNQFAMELHNIVDVVEGLFVETMDDGSVKLTEMSEIIRDFVITALRQGGEVLKQLVDIIKEFSEEGHSMTGMLNSMAIPLKIILNITDRMGPGFLEALVAWKMMNAILPINSALLATNIGHIMTQTQAIVNNYNAKNVENMRSATGLKLTMKENQLAFLTSGRKLSEAQIRGVVSQSVDLETLAKERLNFTTSTLMKSQMAQQMIMFGGLLLTQKIAKDNWALAAVIGGVAGAFMGLSIAMQLTNASMSDLWTLGLSGGARFIAAAAAGFAIGATFNVMMQQMMKPPDLAMPAFDTPSTMDTGGRFMAKGVRSYDMGGYTQDHGLAVLQRGETVISKTQNMLGGGSDSGITLNIHGDVYDSDNFAQKISEVLPTAIRRNNDIGGI